MNSDERILQVLDNSACLSKGQMVGYVKNTLYPEELRAVELHLAGCPLCNDALEGLESQADIEKVLASITPPVLPAVAPREKEKPKEKKEQPAPIKVEKPKPVVVTATTATANVITEVIKRPMNWKRPIALAAALIIGFGAYWYFEMRPKDNKQLAINTEEAVTDTPQQTANETAPIIAQSKVADTVTKVVAVEPKKNVDSIVKRKEELALAKKKDSVGNEKNALAARQMAASPAVAETATADENIAEEKDAQAAKAKKETPKEPQTDYEIGLRLYKQNQYASALMYLKDAESNKSDPKHVDALFYSALCNKYLGKDRRARKQFERIVEANGAYKKAAQKQLDEMKNKD